MYSTLALSGDINLKDPFRLIKYNRQFAKDHPQFFKPDGTIVFCGPQGSGKTLSAVRYVRRLHYLYPAAEIVSNMTLKDIETIPYEGLSELMKRPGNGELGTIVLIDEIQTEFSSLESLKISPSAIAAISQQRKRRTHIVGTSQLFTRISKAYREQINAAIDCDCLFGFLQRNRVIDFARCAYDINGNLTNTAYSRHILWTRSPELFDLYDTTSVITRKGVLDVQR